MADESTGVVYAALAGNVLVALTKFGAAAISGSSAMLTEAVHSTADTVNQVLLLIGTKRSRAPADASHAFGYGMEVYFWTFVVAVVVLLAGGATSIYEGVAHIVQPQPIESPMVSLGVLALSALFEGSSLAFGYREYRRQVRLNSPARNVGMWSFIKRTKDPNLYESLLEDSAALIGIAIATIGVLASAFGRLPWADGAASIGIGLLLIAVSFVIAKATKNLIAGESAGPAVLSRIQAALDSASSTLRVESFKSLQLGPKQIMVTLSIPRSAIAGTLDTSKEFASLIELMKSVDERIVYVFFEIGQVKPIEAEKTYPLKK